MKKKEERKFYKLTVSEAQLDLIMETTEEYFRLRMGQDMDFCNDLASMGREIYNEENRRAFDSFINRRDHMREIMKYLFRVTFEPQGYLKEKTEKMLIAEDIWDAIRYATGRSRWGSRLHTGSEPSMMIEAIGESKE